MEVGSQAVAVDALNCVLVEWYADTVRNHPAYLGGEMEALAVPAPWCRDDCPIFRIVDKTEKEVTRGFCKLMRYLVRLLNLAEWCAVLGSLVLREVNDGSKLMKCCPWL